MVYVSNLVVDMLSALDLVSNPPARPMKDDALCGTRRTSP